MKHKEKSEDQKLKQKEDAKTKELISNKKLRSEKSKEMWVDPTFKKNHERYVEDNIEPLKKSAENARKFLKKTSKLHLKYKESMLRAGLRHFISEFSYGPYHIDEADPLAKIAVEIDGCYWHGCSSCNFSGDKRIKLIDKKKSIYLKNRGWIILRVKEHEILKDENVAIESIRNIQKLRREANKDKIKSAFFKDRLKAQTVQDEEVIWVPVSNVLKHKTARKKALRIITNTADILVTEDHSVFSWDNKEPVLARDLKKGDFIIGSEDNKKAIPLKVTGIEEEDSMVESFDLSVPKTESFLLSSGILAHNSYSISGVSLDVEKSSKYESMKNNFIQEYDKSRDLAKSSIKIVKGLKQPRYGIGISSALGPMSRPGVQSRRNWVSGGNYG